LPCAIRPRLIHKPKCTLAPAAPRQSGYWRRRAKVKRPQVSNYALLHTSATLAYRYTRDLRALQDMLGHQDPKITARYARVVDRAKSNPALEVPVEL